MPTTPRGIWFPDSAASTEIWTLMQEQAETTDVAIGAAQDAATEEAQDEIRQSVANVAALPGVGDLYPGKRVWLLDQKTHAVYDGANWKVPIQAGTGATGTLVANTAKTVHVAFPTAYPVGVVPVVTVTPAIGAFPQNRFAAVGDIDEDGFDALVINTASTTQFTFKWISKG